MFLPTHSRLLEHLSQTTLAHYRPTGRQQCGVTDLRPFVFHPSRFDLMAKIRYAEAYLAGRPSRWARELYLEHIRAFNGFDENDGSGKRGPDAFLAAFHSVLDAPSPVDVSPLNVIPLTESGIAVDGGHRLARAFVRSEPVNLVFVEETRGFDQEFFRQRGLKDFAGNAIAFEYGQRNDSAQCFVLFPSLGRDMARAEMRLEAETEVFFKKRIPWGERAPRNIISALYFGEEWLGPLANQFPGAVHKHRPCFARRGWPMTFYVLNKSRSDSLPELKARLRQEFGLEKHSLHCSMSAEEKLAMLQLFLNEHTLHWANSGRPVRARRFTSLYERYRPLPEADTRCLVGSAALAAHGLRDVADLDYVGQSAEGCEPEAFDNQNQYLARWIESLGHKVQDVIEDPRLHMYFFGRKVMSLSLALRIKVRRRERKDFADLMRFVGLVVVNAVRDIASRLVWPIWRRRA